MSEMFYAQRWVTEEDHKREVTESYLAGRRAAVSENYEHWSNMMYADRVRIMKEIEEASKVWAWTTEEYNHLISIVEGNEDD